jgi:hypothetical protein
MKESSAEQQRLLELLADRSIFGIDAEEERELDALLLAHPACDSDGLDRLAAAVSVATSPSESGDLPTAVRARLRDGAARFVRHRGQPAVRAAKARGQFAGAGGRAVPLAAIVTIATAASVAIVFILGRWNALQEGLRVGGEGPMAVADNASEKAATLDGRQKLRPDSRAVPMAVDAPAQQREAMLASVRDAVRLDCAAAAGAGETAAAGDVVWSPSRQRGFLRISGLAKNDRSRSQYQIWIVNGNRRHPVAAGVFDVDRETGDVIVPILPQAFVQGPTMFAVTVEQPGGADDYSADRARVVARAD